MLVWAYVWVRVKAIRMQCLIDAKLPWLLQFTFTYILWIILLMPLSKKVSIYNLTFIYIYRLVYMVSHAWFAKLGPLKFSYNNWCSMIRSIHFPNISSITYRYVCIYMYVVITAAQLLLQCAYVNFRYQEMMVWWLLLLLSSLWQFFVAVSSWIVHSSIAVQKMNKIRVCM